MAAVVDRQCRLGAQYVARRRGPDLSEIQARIDAGDPTLDPLGDLGPLDDLPRDRSRSNR